jgi:hypothetical protein
MHELDEDGATLRVCMLGYLRPGTDFKSLGQS